MPPAINLLLLTFLIKSLSGLLLACPAPAVTIPAVLEIKRLGVRVDESLISEVVATVAINSITTLTAFGIMTSIVFSSGSEGSLVGLAIAEVAVGISGGLLLAMFIVFCMSMVEDEGRNTFLLMMCYCLTPTCIYLGSLLSKTGGAYCLCFFFGYGLRKWLPMDDKVFIDTSYAQLFFKIGLNVFFTLSGVGIPVQSIQSQTVGGVIGVVFIGLLARVAGQMLALARPSKPMGWRIKLFTVLCFCPKASVQAALYGSVLAVVKSGVYLSNSDQPKTDQLAAANVLASIGAISILITAPVFALLIFGLGPTLLNSDASKRSAAAARTSLAVVGFELAAVGPENETPKRRATFGFLENAGANINAEDELMASSDVNSFPAVRRRTTIGDREQANSRRASRSDSFDNREESPTGNSVRRLSAAPSTHPISEVQEDGSASAVV